jgi:putative sigma-54 modulation protein
MKIRITSRHQKLALKLREYIEEKMERLERYYDRIIDCDVILGKEKTNDIVEVNVKVFGSVLHVRAKETDTTKAVDVCIDKLEIQLKKFKEKMKKHPRVRMASVLADNLQE